MQYIEELLDILEVRFYKGTINEFPRYEITKDLKEIFCLLENIRVKCDIAFEDLYSWIGFFKYIYNNDDIDDIDEDLLEINKKITGGIDFTYAIDSVIFWNDDNPHLKEMIGSLPR